MAERFPERNFLGIEKLPGRVRRACKKASRLALPNVRFLRVESAYAIQYLLPPASVDAVHLLFPDPWPKKKHRRRRIVTSGFSGVGASSARAGRSLSHRDGPGELFRSHARADRCHLRFVEMTPADGETFPVTTFEKHFLAEGASIYRLELRKTL